MEGVVCMALPALLRGRLSLPLIAAPLFLVSGPALVIEACRHGVIGAFPTVNARTTDELDRWLGEIAAALADVPDAAPPCANLIVHRSNTRLAHEIRRAHV